MKKIEITKKVVRYIASYGSGIIVTSIINNNVRPQRIDQQVGVVVAGFAVGSAVGEVAGNQTDKIIDDLVDLITN